MRGGRTVDLSVTISARQNNAVFRAIADPTRREILRLLRGRRHTVGEIAANFHTSRPAISKHIRMLRSAGLVVAEKHGAASIGGLNAKPLRFVDAWLRDYQAFWGASMHGLKTYIEEREGKLSQIWLRYRHVADAVDNEAIRRMHADHVHFWPVSRRFVA